MFLPIIEATTKNNKIIEDAMEFINTSLFEIDKNKTKSHEKTWFKQHLKYLKEEKKMLTRWIRMW